MKAYPALPGKGLNTSKAITARQAYLKEQGISTEHIGNSQLKVERIKHNIEGLIGSVEIPVGVVGPLVLNGDEKEAVYAPIATLEGALVASMNRGAKVVSQSGGFDAVVIHQKMVRSPMFSFTSISECLIFKNWVESAFEAIKTEAEQYSNHATLEEIIPVVASRSVHLKFVYSTGDASGQNMTTTCTWHAVLWIKDAFEEASGIQPTQYLIEGNASSDKKVSHFAINHGRGIHVIAECELSEVEIERTLHVTADDLVRCVQQSQTMMRLDGMVGYNINVTNAIAGIFAATGQDLASIHESGTGILHLERTQKGVYCSLHLPTLVIGTIGGGTHLPKQREALEMMGCYGKGKVQRFAKIIAGMALALEISTASAIVGGQFAKAHEKLGRNKPVNWLLRADLNHDFIQKMLPVPVQPTLKSVDFLKKDLVENGIIISLTSRINKKLTGFVPLQLDFEGKPTEVLLKSKPLDKEVVQGLHFMAASIDSSLSDLIAEYAPYLEYKNSHLKELELYELLHQKGISDIPKWYGSYKNEEREAFLFIIEMLQTSHLALFNSENEPEKWQPEHIESTIKSIHGIHSAFYDAVEKPATVSTFLPWKAKVLYHKFADLLIKQYKNTSYEALVFRLRDLVEELEEDHHQLNIPKTLIHNDFNPRNVAVKNDGTAVIYDWELAVWDIPHRDVVEMLSFALEPEVKAADAMRYFKYHYELQAVEMPWEAWKKGYSYALKAFLVTRVSFYLTGKILVDYPFAERVLATAFRILDVLENEELE